MAFDTLTFYWNSLRRAFRELYGSYGLTTPVQKINTFLTLLPFLVLSIGKIATDGIGTFISNLPSSSLDILIGLVWFAVVLFVNIIRAPYLLKKDSDQKVEELQRELSAITAKLEPRLVIDFQDTNPFVFKNANAVLLRVRVSNLSQVEPLRNVKIQLEAIEPENLPVLPMTLHQMHDNPIPGTLNLQTFDLPPSGYQFIDVVNIVSTGQEIHYYLEHVVRNAPNEALLRLTSLALSAFSDSCPPQTETFDLVNSNSRYILMRRQRGA